MSIIPYIYSKFRLQGNISNIFQTPESSRKLGTFFGKVEDIIVVEAMSCISFFSSTYLRKIPNFKVLII